MNIYVIDTNVILLAGTRVGEITNEQLTCFEGCIRFLNEMMNCKDSVLIDDEGKILQEYKYAFKVNEYPNMATSFFEYAMGHVIFAHLNEIGENVFEQYPNDITLKEFDPPDRKFIALSYVYEQSVPIVEATDDKWWGIKELLRKYGVEVIFIDEDYIKTKYQKKMG